jgi:predicted nucleic acid-binding protein
MSGVKYLLDTNYILGLLKSIIEDVAIAVRRTRKVKLPDAIIAATAIHHQVELLTLDVGLQAVARDGFEASNRL